MDSEPNLPYKKKRKVPEDRAKKAQKELIRRKSLQLAQIYKFPKDDGHQGIKKF